MVSAWEPRSRRRASLWARISYHDEASDTSESPMVSARINRQLRIRIVWPAPVSGDDEIVQPLRFEGREELVELLVIGGCGLVFSAVSRSISARNAHFASVYVGSGVSWKAFSGSLTAFRLTSA